MILIIFLILIVAVIVVVSIKVGNLKHRAVQHALKDTSLSDSNLSAQFGNVLGKKSMEKFLSDHASYTEQSLKDMLMKDTQDIFSKTAGDELTGDVVEKMQKDSKLDKMKSMEYKRAYLNFYKNEKMGAFVVYSDGRDEYNVFLSCLVDEDNIKVQNYRINKGATVGF